MATPGRRQRKGWWLIARNGDDRLEVLTFDLSGEQTLPVFSFEEEARVFLWLGGADAGGWQPRRTGPGELVSMLYGPFSGTSSVALDPLPGMVTDGTVGLVSVDRERFVNRILAAGDPTSLRRLAVPRPRAGKTETFDPLACRPPS
jgi:hypothetical protein